MCLAGGYEWWRYYKSLTSCMALCVERADKYDKLI